MNEFSPLTTRYDYIHWKSQSRFTKFISFLLLCFVKINVTITLVLFFFFTYKIHLKTGNTFFKKLEGRQFTGTSPGERRSQWLFSIQHWRASGLTYFKRSLPRMSLSRTAWHCPNKVSETGSLTEWPKAPLSQMTFPRKFCSLLPLGSFDELVLQGKPFLLPGEDMRSLSNMTVLEHGADSQHISRVAQNEFSIKWKARVNASYEHHQKACVFN